MASEHHRRKRAMRLLRQGLATVAEAAQIAMVSRQRVLVWCSAAGIDPRAARKQWVARQIALADLEDAHMGNRNWGRAKRSKPTEDSREHPGIMAPLLRGKPRPAGPSKAELRAAADAAAVATPVKRLAAVVKLKCLACMKHSEARAQDGQPIACRYCGSKAIERRL